MDGTIIISYILVVAIIFSLNVFQAELDGFLQLGQKLLSPPKNGECPINILT